MPTTKLKNAVYRLALPFCAPNCPVHPVTSVSGRDLISLRGLESLLRKHHVLGSAVLLTSGEQHCLICTASDSPKHEAFPDTYFRVASITKAACSVLCGRLIDEGMLDPDRPVSEYFADESARSSLEGITLVQLLSHTSGIIDPSGLETSVENGVPFTDFLSGARLYQPGSSFHYSNLGFGLIGCVLESVLGLPVGQIFRERLFDPLQMNATLEASLLPRKKIMPVTRVLPYVRGKDVVITKLGSRPLLSPDPLRHYGHTAGSMYTEIGSLQKLLDVFIHEDNPFLSARMKDEICREHATYGTLSPTLGCVDGAFWEKSTGRSVIMLNGGAGEARTGRLGLLNKDILRWAFRKELPAW